MVGTKGRNVANLDEAEAFVREFILENEARSRHQFDNHSHDFDLYLPWLFECVTSPGNEGSLTICELGVLYMDAAWSLTQKGYLRPGPRSVMGQDMATLGKGYSLTPLGRRWLKEPAMAAAQ